MSITATATTFTKLRNGSWGVKGTCLAAGRIVGVAKRDGSHSNVTIDKVIWTDGKVQIASIKSDRAATAARYSRPAGHSCECCGAPNARYARDLSGIGGYACRTCNDGALSFC